MSILEAIILAIVQGITEFLPISSSGHLVLAGGLFEEEKLHDVSFDVAVHFGSLIAVVAYFWKDIKTVTADWFRSLRAGEVVGQSFMGWAVIWGTVPIGLYGLIRHFVDDNNMHAAYAMALTIVVGGVLAILGFMAINKKHIAKNLFYALVILVILIVVTVLLKGAIRSNVVVALTTIMFAFALWYGDSKGTRDREMNSIDWHAIIIIGVAQAVALIPGTSRSGITMAAALMLGFKREAAARYSFFLAIPAIMLATISQCYKLIKYTECTPAAGCQFLSEKGVKIDLSWAIIGLGTVVSAVVAFICIKLFLKFIEKIGMMPFVIYRILMGIGIFVLIAMGIIKSGLA